MDHDDTEEKDERQHGLWHGLAAYRHHERQERYDSEDHSQYGWASRPVGGLATNPHSGFWRPYSQLHELPSLSQRVHADTNTHTPHYSSHEWRYGRTGSIELVEQSWNRPAERASHSDNDNQFTALAASTQLHAPEVPPPVSLLLLPASSSPMSQSKPEKKPSRTCKTDGCDNYIVFKGLCCRHGGGKKCSVDGCQTSAKHKGLCWRHGGSVECKIVECTKRAKARGLCWAHGGGTKCSDVDCDKVAVSNGYCWAHGGGRRCIYDGCVKPAYKRTHSFCTKHYAELQDVDYYEV